MLSILFLSQRYLLLLDSIRQCEGVAKLLQNSSGKEVAVKPAKTNKVSLVMILIMKQLGCYEYLRESPFRFHFSFGFQVTPGELPQEDNSPVTQILEAIPPELCVTTML